LTYCAHTQKTQHKHMRTKTTLLTAALLAAGALSSMAQVYSVNIVGYINLTIPKGFSMIANQLNASPDNTLATVLAGVPENTTAYKFIPTPPPAHYQSSNFSADNPGWTIPGVTLNPGEGVFISIDPSQAPSGYTATFVGEVQLSSATPVKTGFSMLSSAIPQQGGVETLLGFPSRENDTIYKWDGSLNAGKGGFRSFNFSADNPGWSPSEPVMNVGEAFFISSDPQQGGDRSWTRTFVVGPP